MTKWIGALSLCTFSILFQPTVFRTACKLSAQIVPLTVPAEYQDLYGSLDASLTSFNGAVNAAWDKSKGSTAFSAHLLSANSLLGPTLLQPQHYAGVLMELDGLKAMGVKAIAVSIDFPILYPAYFDDASEFQGYLDFYTRLAKDIRARGLKLIVESQVLLTQTGLGTLNPMPFYQSLTLEQYRKGRMENARTIAQALKPDYLSVISEPDTEAMATGKPELNTVAGSTALLKTILYGIQQAGVTGVSVGAGVGSWQKSYQLFVASYAATTLDYIDVHVYPANRDFLTRLFQIADIAYASGKRLAISEAWLFKVRDSELPGLSGPMAYARDPFSFWAPLDIKFLRALVNFAHCKRLEFLAPFWSNYFRAYVDFSAFSRNLAPSEMNTLANTMAARALHAGAYTSTGLAFANAITAPADTLPPSPPSSVSAITSSPGSVFVAWSGATDNVGVASYKVYRNGVEIATTAATAFSDRSLPGPGAYYYTICAFDIGGRSSGLSPAASAFVPRLRP